MKQENEILISLAVPEEREKRNENREKEGEETGIPELKNELQDENNAGNKGNLDGEEEEQDDDETYHGKTKEEQIKKGCEMYDEIVIRELINERKLNCEEDLNFLIERQYNKFHVARYNVNEDDNENKDTMVIEGERIKMHENRESKDIQTMEALGRKESDLFEGLVKVNEKHKIKFNYV